MHKILITGASGLVGTRLTEMLLSQGHEVSHLGRVKRDGEVRSFTWDVHGQRMDIEALDGIDTIIHLAGAGIADKPWTKSRKKEILESRTLSTRLLFNTLKNAKHNVKHFIAASAIGYYGFEDEETNFTEDHSAGNDFLAQVVKQWEQEVQQLSTLGLRVVRIRIGIVLSQKGGALKELITPMKFYAGAPLGSGKQQLSWIHLDDLCAMFVKAVHDNDMGGVYNGVGPYSVSNATFTKTLAAVMGKPIVFPNVPAIALKLLFGEMANLVLKGNRVSSQKIQEAGFEYQYPSLEGALKDLLKK